MNAEMESNHAWKKSDRLSIQTLLSSFKICGGIVVENSRLQESDS